MMVIFLIGLLVGSFCWRIIQRISLDGKLRTIDTTTSKVVDGVCGFNDSSVAIN